MVYEIKEAYILIGGTFNKHCTSLACCCDITRGCPKGFAVSTKWYVKKFSPVMSLNRTLEEQISLGMQRVAICKAGPGRNKRRTGKMEIAN